MLRHLMVILAFTLLTGCAGFGGSTITDYEQRSVGYGWIDIDDVDGNRLFSVIMRQYKPKTDKPFYHMAIEKMDGGYLFYHYGFSNGAYKADTASAQTCVAILCGNTINEYSFGRQGTDGTLVIERPGIYFIGGFKLVEEDTGFFEQAKFRIEPADNVPNRKELLNVIKQNSPQGHPVLIQRIENALK